MQRRGASQRQRQEADLAPAAVRAREAAAAFEHERFNVGRPQPDGGAAPDPASPAAAKRRRINRALGDEDGGAQLLALFTHLVTTTARHPDTGADANSMGPPARVLHQDH